MTGPASLTGRRNATPQGQADLLAWLTRADEELKRVAMRPNELLPRLLAAGCQVTFAQHEDGQRVTVDLTMPDGSHVTEAGANVVHALLEAYGSGGYLADLPRLLTETSDAPAPEGTSVAPVLPFTPERTTP